MGQGTFYITTPIYYVNDRPHIGHAYTTILADVLARYHRLLGLPTHFLTGTDEHGQKVQEAAERHGISAQEQCDQTVVRFQELWERLSITHDDFIRTTEARHTSVVQAILQDLFDRGEIYAGEYEGWYCVPCERFYTEKDLAAGVCPECGREVERICERNYFFRMSAYQDWLVSYIDSHPSFIQPEHRRQETLGFLRQPLGDLCISRPKNRLAWGIELPFDADYVTYVWFDALVNYISAIGYGRDGARFERWWPASYHLIGKDILTTHTVYWPTMLKAIGVAMPETIFAHGWWLVGRSKMSKSAGNVVNPMEMAERYGVDAFRYFLMAEMTLGQDAAFTEEAFVTRYNADLANDLGNLTSRVVKMIIRDLGGRIPPVPAPGADEEELVAATLGAVVHMREHVDAMRPDLGLAEVLAAVRAGNRYFDYRKPWVQARDGQQQALSETLYHAAECLRIVAGLLFPVMPERMAALRSSLGIDAPAEAPRLDDLSEWGGLPAGVAVRADKPLFPRIAPTEGGAASGRQRGVDGGGKRATGGESGGTKDRGTSAGLIDIKTFGQVELKTAVVRAAEAIEGADKLLKLHVDLGDETRQLVAGIARDYAPDKITGKTVIVVTNLKPATLFGVESQGMLLAAHGETGLRVITADGDVEPGAVVS